MHREYRRRHSPGLDRETELLVVGHAGAPALVFPTSMGKFDEREDRGMLGPRRVDDGRPRFYCIDGHD
jgi:esterase/lipase superfamily enzyme